MKEIIRMVVALSVICSISGVVLASLKQATRGRIEEQVLTYVQGPALNGVFSEVENNPILDRKKMTMEDGREITVFPAMRGGKLIGVALEAFGKGYSSDIGVMVGFDIANDTLVGIGVTTMSETPGLGTQVGEKRYTEQFAGHALGAKLALKNKGGDIDAISGASFSSAGSMEAVQNAAKIYSSLKKQILSTWQG